MINPVWLLQLQHLLTTMKVLDQFAAKQVEEVETLFSILKDLYPKLKVDITYNYNEKLYDIKLLDVEEEQDSIQIPLDLDVKVIYGDSVTKDTPILIKDPTTKFVDIITIESIGIDWQDYPGFKINDNTISEKQFALTDKLVWTNGQWRAIKKVIRHKCNKPIYKISTRTGIVHVTEDHSLIKENGSVIKPLECEIGIKLLSSYPPPFLTHYFVPLTPEYAFKYGTDLATQTTLDRLPIEFMNANTTLKREFWNGFCKKMIELKRMTVDKHNFCLVFEMNLGTLVSSHLFFIAKQLGYHVTLYNIIDNIIEFHVYVTQTDDHPIHNTNAISSITLDKHITDQNFVYDLETDNSQFQAGIGSLIVHNTDSIMCKFSYNRKDKDANRLDTFRLAELCGEKLTKEVFNRHPIEMEFENVKNPFILIAKKHYIGKKFEDKKNPLKMKGYDVKGVALTKRNYCNLVKKCYKEVIDYVMTNEEKSIDGIKDIIQRYLDDIRLYKVNIDDLVITASLAKSYKNENLPHVHLANKLRARKEEVQVGDRIPFVFIEDEPGVVTKKFERSEDPKYAKEHHLKIDRLSYLDQVTKPIIGLLKIVLQKHPREFNVILSRINETIVECNGKPLKEKDLEDLDDKDLE